MYQYDLRKEKQLQRIIINYAESINLICTEQECVSTHPVTLEERDRRETFIDGLRSISDLQLNIDVVTALMCAFTDFEADFLKFESFYSSTFHTLSVILNTH